MGKPFILITGDDSIRGEGIILVKRVVEKFADFQIVATKDQMSAVGAALNLKGGEWGKETVDGHEAIWVDGYPSDAAYFALDYLEKLPDLVISGVNHGENIEESTMIRSGTVACAMTTAKRNIPTIAFSRRVPIGGWLDGDKKEFHESLLEYPGKLIEKIVKKALDYNFPDHTFWNVNFPENPTNTLKVVPASFAGSYPNNKKITGNRYDHDLTVIDYTNQPVGTDAYELTQGNATITPCKIQFNVESEMEKLRDTFDV